MLKMVLRFPQSYKKVIKKSALLFWEIGSALFGVNVNALLKILSLSESRMLLEIFLAESVPEVGKWICFLQVAGREIF